MTLGSFQARPGSRPRPASSNDSALEQTAQIGGNVVDASAVAHEQANAPFLVEDIRAGRVVHRVRRGGLTRDLLIENLEFLRGNGRLLGRTIQSDETRIEGGHILRQ